LNPAANAILSAAAAGSVFLCYVFAVTSTLALLIIISLEFIPLIVLLRFGLAGLVARVMGEHLAVLTLFFRSFWLRKGVECRVPVNRSEAPALFSKLDMLCRRVGVALPHQVFLEMHTNARVVLRGYRRGAGLTNLGLGYDLLAGLLETEIEAVLAHELTHAKLVQRGLKHWLGSGLGRAGQLARGLSVQVQIGRRSKWSLQLARPFLVVADRLARLAARQVAAYSRQDEFAADRGAAELCGAGPLRSALIKLAPLAGMAARLPWNERVGRLQLQESFSQWLVGELSAAAKVQPLEPSESLFDQYATHPGLSDRLAALPVPEGEEPGESPPAIGLLARPDQVAERLIAEVQRVLVQQELNDSKQLRRWKRKAQASRQLRPLQGIGVIIIGASLVIGPIIWLIAGMPLSLGIATVLAAFGGIVVYRMGYYRERIQLEVPDFAVIKAAGREPVQTKLEQVKELEDELRARAAAAQSGRRKRAFWLASEAYAALRQCNYLRAHVGARLSLENDKKSTEGAVALVISAGALGQVSQVHSALTFLQTTTGFTATSLAWCAAWGLLLCGDFGRAEAFLETVQARQPENPTLLALLAICRSRRGKLQSAIVSARQAYERRRGDVELAKLLIDLLLQGGYVREAQERLRDHESQVHSDPELAVLMVHVNLLLSKPAAADDWAEMAKNQSRSGQVLIRLGGLYELARNTARAQAHYQSALKAGHYPEALLGLGRLCALHKDKHQARIYILQALDTTRQLGLQAVGPLPLLPRVISQLLTLEEPVTNCRAWIATFSAKASPAFLANTSLMVYAPGRQAAEDSLQVMVRAMEPSAPPELSLPVFWREAPSEQQPAGPVRPGVQGLTS
jgi:Zn-dependent protease with chaperone function/tetratricopeptide (TPR) repeat protein